MSEQEKPNCYKCKFRGALPGDCHSTCSNRGATVQGREHGIRNGWFFWPYNFDPVWLESCTGFQAKETAKQPVLTNKEGI